MARQLFAELRILKKYLLNGISICPSNKLFAIERRNTFSKCMRTISCRFHNSRASQNIFLNFENSRVIIFKRWIHSSKSSKSFTGQEPKAASAATIANVISTFPPLEKPKEKDTETLVNQHEPLQDSSIVNYKPLPESTLSHILKSYKELSKAKLAALVILTTMGGYALSPGSTSLMCLLGTSVGTGLCVASANAINQWIEFPYDAQMSRTRNRVLVRRALTPFHAFAFGTISGISGLIVLSMMANSLTALMGVTNILLYTCIYTPMKRASILNTWVGSIVGAIPPMMGWVASTNNLDPGCWLLGGILYAWQFPHFNSLAWNLRADYSKAGYRMMAVTNPALNARVALRYSLLLFPWSYMIPYMGMTSWWFAFDSTLVNSVLLWGSYKFWRNSNDKTARDCFFASLIHLPVIFALMMLHKRYQSGENLDVPDK
ncbi:10803_t:CDS:1 [Ambispora leptoticha]|uniref:Protoheme IX farnesyltransferase, mitochondrial n=1 Tax=Ambispora leptoticha TaxID=144679 RepID=A0A9N8Z4J2_9GLOM|nr:10803_t:CDS:1 [Ambispora leptoticha]